MKAIDTNILVRFLVQDDVRQANKVIQLFTKAEQYNEPLFVPLPGVCPRIENLLQKSPFGHFSRSFSLNSATIRLK